LTWWERGAGASGRLRAVWVARSGGGEMELVLEKVERTRDVAGRTGVDAVAVVREKT